MFVVIEGLDGVGKTTVITSLAQKTGWINVVDEIKNMREHFKQMPQHSPAMDNLLNLAFLQHISDTAKLLIEQGKIVISDRYTPSQTHYTAIFYKSAFREGSVPNISTEQLNLAKPDLVIVLKVREDIRQKRLQERGAQSEHELSISQDSQIRNNLQSRLERSADIILDVSDLNISQTVDLLKEWICAKIKSPGSSINKTSSHFPKTGR